MSSMAVDSTTSTVSTSSASECCYVCTECPNSFSSLNELEKHLLRHNKNNNEEHEEEEMGQHSPSSSESARGGDDEIMLDVDMEDSMMDLKPGYHCRFCRQSFDDQSQLNVHYTHTHRDKPQYECEICHTVFAVKRELSTHMRIHSGEQPHKCTQCGKEFGTRQLLKKHWMWHTGERNHVCKHCNKAFFQKGHLTQHLMIHSGGRPHQCELCQKTFIFKFDLNRHMKIHAERGFSCTQCGRSFQRQNSLDEHMMKCKGKSIAVRSSPIRTPPGSYSPSPFRFPPTAATTKPKNSMSPSQESLFPLLNQSVLNFTTDQMAKMAQSLLAQQNQQRALSALFLSASNVPQVQNLVNYSSASSTSVDFPDSPTTSSQPVAPTPSPYMCMVCNKQFPNQQFYTLHMYTSHFQTNSTCKDDLENTTPLLASSLFGPVNPIKTEDEEQMINVHSETATNSSCASSPLKASPVSSHSPATFMASSPLSPKKATLDDMKHDQCSDCDVHKNRTEELENALRLKSDELQKYKDMMKAVVTTAGHLLNQCSTENVYIAHTKNIFNQLQSTLLTSE
ncbi:unnamed protein product [Auanema sp. JU1783]|nr:unnamed protein product [Auanema sp. JU1783]